MAGGKLGPSKDGRHASFNMKSITLTDGCLPIAWFQERSRRPSRTEQVVRPTYSNASPFRPNRPTKNEGIRRPTAQVPWLEPSLVERLIGSIRLECVDHLVVLSERRGGRECWKELLLHRL